MKVAWSSESTQIALPLFQTALVIVCFDHAARVIVPEAPM